MQTEAPTVTVYHHDVDLRSAVNPPEEVSGQAKFAQNILNRLMQGSNGGQSSEYRFAVINAEGKGKPDRDVLAAELNTVLSESLHDLGDVPPQRIFNSTIEIMDAVIKTPTLAGINKGYTLDLVRWCIESARNPDLISQTAMRVGYGGSDDENIAMRHPAYVLPAITMWERLRALSERRFNDAKKQYVYEGLDPENFGDAAMPINEKKQLMNQQVAHVLQDHEFTEDELAEIKAKYQHRFGFFDLPKIELIFAYHAGIQINHKDHVRTVEQAKESQKLTGAFIERFYPDVAPYITIREDSPEMRTNEYTPLILGYLTEIVDKAYDSDDSRFNTLKKALRRLAENHGKPEGYEGQTGDGDVRSELEKSIEYAVKHVYFFQDRVQIPSTSAVTQKDNTLATISIGGRPERLFNDIRQLISENATASGFVAYAERQGTDPHKMAVINRWYSLYSAARSDYEPGNISNDWVSADLPLLTMPMMTDIGRCPVYYTRTADALITPNHIAEARQVGIKSVMDRLYHESGDTSKEAEEWHRAVTSDMLTLLNHIKEDQLLDFFADCIASSTV